MSGTFTGFSEDDIKMMQNGLPIQKQTHSGKQVKLVLKNKRSTRPIVRFDESRNIININDVSDIPESAKLCKSKTDGTTNKSDEHTTSKTDEDTTSQTDENTASKTDENTASKTDENTTSNIERVDVTETNVIENNVSQIKNDDSNKIEMVRINLDEFEVKQKLIEEQNRKRKELLVKVLADKKRQTQEEAQKLNEIQNEFRKLDAVLSTDVKLLRKKIEIASIDYMEAQKRYMKIEKEFLESKLGLQQKLEKKELLTGHLYTIIEKNEERKAEKLTELLNKLELKDISESEISNAVATEQ